MAQECTTALDCGDVSLFVCDPTTRLCKAADCSTTKTCSAGKTCVQQASGVTVGICLRKCREFGTTTGCDAGDVCVGIPFSSNGFCQKRGTAAKLGDACDVSVVDTGCVEGICRKSAETDAKGTCVAFCDPFDTTTTCPSGKICTGTWDCTTNASAADPATLETFCGVGELSCNVAGSTAQGLCVEIYAGPICRHICRFSVPADCPSRFVCASRGRTITVGVCIPGDGACQDGGSGSCSECRATEEAASGCCAAESAACTTTECKAFVDCAMACKRNKPCVDACVATNPTAAKVGTPLFLCISGYGGGPGGACGDVCLGPDVCGDFDGPDITSTCSACGTRPCRANGCFNGFYCNRVTKTCAAPTALPACPSGDAGTDTGTETGTDAATDGG
jgi:hypothetical protein